MIAVRQNPLARLSDSQLIKKLDALVQKERKATLEVIRHITEFDRRKLYLGIGYGSLYDYCTLHLGFSEAAAMRRIQTARCIIDFPEIYRMLENNELNLTGVCMLLGILTESNKKEVFKAVRCKSKRQIEEIVARYKPGKDIKDRVRPIFVKTTPETAPNASKSSAPGNSNSRNIRLNPDNSKQENWGKFTTAGGGEKSAASQMHGLCNSGKTPPQNTFMKKKYKLEFTVDPECMKKVEEVKAILSKKYPEGVPLGILLEEMADEYLEKHSPEQKKQRREKRQAKQGTKKKGKQGESNNSKRFRHIPQAVQDKVYARDKGRCTFVGPKGVRCNSTWNLEIDHVKPYGRGGSHSIRNLRLLCGRHNQHEAEKTYGEEFIKQQRYKAKSMRK